jgi:hypothetical protein
MWANHLSQQPDLFSPGRPVQFGPLETVTVGRGIDDRWWGPAPSDATANEEHDVSAAREALAAAELAYADIDTDELLVLITDADVGKATTSDSPLPHRRPRPRSRRSKEKR